jgi:MFS transporter, BCD family, chlorophyll transporter
MASSNVSDSPDFSPQDGLKVRNLNLLSMFRLGLFQMGLGVLAVMTLGVLNRVMIAELGIPASVTAATLAMYLFVSPASVWFGQMSDSKPLFGRQHRTGYVWLGTALFTFILFLALKVVWQLGSLVQANGGWAWTTQTTSWTALLAFMMALYGLAISLSTTSFFAMLVDVSDDDDRGKLIGIVWTMMTVGIAVGGISSKILLKPIENVDASIDLVRSAITNAFIIVPAAVFVLALLALFGMEKKYSRYRSRATQNLEEKLTLGQALKILTANRQTKIFFGFMILMTLGLFLQEAVLEPYGGEIFRLSIPQTSLLNSYWGVGMLMSLSATGFLLIPRLGKRRTTALGCLAVAFCFVLIILSGFTGNAKLFQGLLVLFGLSAGVATTGALSLMLDLTAAETAGTFVGAWSLAQAIARGTAVTGGGFVLEAGTKLFGANYPAYASVFALQVLVMLAAVWLLGRVNVKEFRNNAEQAIAAVMKSDLE